MANEKDGQDQMGELSRLSHCSATTRFDMIHVALQSHMFPCYIDNYPSSIDHLSDLSDLILSALKQLIAEDNGELSGRATLLQQFANGGKGGTEVLGPNGELLGHSLTTADDGGGQKKKRKTRKSLAGLPRDVRVLAVDAEARGTRGGIGEEVRGRLNVLWSDDVESANAAPHSNGDLDGVGFSYNESEEEDFRPPATQAFGHSTLLSRLGASRNAKEGKSMFHAESAFASPVLRDELEIESGMRRLQEVDDNLPVAEGSGRQPFRQRRDDDAGSSLRRETPQQSKTAFGERPSKRLTLNEDDFFGPTNQDERTGGSGALFTVGPSP